MGHCGKQTPHDLDRPSRCKVRVWPSAAEGRSQDRSSVEQRPPLGCRRLQVSDMSMPGHFECSTVRILTLTLTHLAESWAVHLLRDLGDVLRLPALRLRKSGRLRLVAEQEVHVRQRSQQRRLEGRHCAQQQPIVVSPRRANHARVLVLEGLGRAQAVQPWKEDLVADPHLLTGHREHNTWRIPSP